MTVKEDIGFGQIGDKEEKITVSEHDQRMCRKELQKVSTIGYQTYVFDVL